MVVVGGGSGCEFSITTSHKPLNVLRVPLRTGLLSELKMVASFFVKSAEKLESPSCLIEGRLAILSFVYAWFCVDVYCKIRRGRCIESVSLNN